MKYYMIVQSSVQQLNDGFALTSAQDEMATRLSGVISKQLARSSENETTLFFSSEKDYLKVVSELGMHARSINLHLGAEIDVDGNEAKVLNCKILNGGAYSLMTDKLPDNFVKNYSLDLTAKMKAHAVEQPGSEDYPVTLFVINQPIKMPQSLKKLIVEEKKEDIKEEKIGFFAKVAQTDVTLGNQFKMAIVSIIGDDKTGFFESLAEQWKKLNKDTKGDYTTFELQFNIAISNASKEMRQIDKDFTFKANPEIAAKLSEILQDLKLTRLVQILDYSLNRADTNLESSKPSKK